MITTSSALKTKMQETLAPESFVEIKYGIVDSDYRSLAETSCNEEAVFSNTAAVTQNEHVAGPIRYATLEQNVWVLDGTRPILPDTGPYLTPGYVCTPYYQESGGLVISFPETQTKSVPGLTITWSSEYGDYATGFNVVISGPDGETRFNVTGNTSVTSMVEREFSNYDTVTIIPTGWSHPGRLIRIDQVVFGVEITLDKNDIVRFEHEQTASVVSGEIPTNSVSFAINNVDGRWNPLNPTGVGRYLSERQRVVVRYGLDIDGATEWVEGGTFYLSEWYAPSNGTEASFVARDSLDFLLNTTFKHDSATRYTLGGLAHAALEQADALGFKLGCHMDQDHLDSIQCVQTDYNYSISEILQVCANAGRCWMSLGRAKGFAIVPSDSFTNEDYPITLDSAYAYPEVALSKPVQSVKVQYYETADGTDDSAEYTLALNSSGEIQTVDNPLIATEGVAAAVAGWVNQMLGSRKTISGDIRVFPILDVYDRVSVETKYGTIDEVVLTKIKYSYTGSFRATYEGRVL